MHLNYQHIGKRIKFERKHMGISQAQLAELADLSVQYISQIERGVRHLSLDVMANIADALNASVDMLLFGASRSEIGRNFGDYDETFGERGSNDQDVVLEIVLAAKKILHSHKINI